MNKLTERLLSEGYTKENHPDYVRWSNYGDFEYTRGYLEKAIWETPCGLLKNGSGSYNHMSHMGIDYCPENNNPRYGCPYFDEQPCPYRINNKLMGCNCIYHQTDRPYDYAQSVEKLWNEWDKIKSEAWQKATAEYGFCACMVWDRPKKKYMPRYDVDACISSHCQNEVCAITKKQRNLEKVNIYYDILRERKYKKGFVVTTDRQLEKGIKKLERPVARTDAEIWLRVNEKDFKPKMSRFDRQELFFSEYHGKTGFDGYEWFEFSISPQNIRIERRESRDLMQDLRDIREGIEVVHASDTEKSAKQAKKERRKEYKKAKAARKAKTIAKNLISALSDETKSESMKQWAKQELERRGIETEPKYEQIGMF